MLRTAKNSKFLFVMSPRSAFFSSLLSFHLSLAISSKEIVDQKISCRGRQAISDIWWVDEGDNYKTFSIACENITDSCIEVNCYNWFRQIACKFCLLRQAKISIFIEANLTQEPIIRTKKKILLFKHHCNLCQTM